MPSSPRLPHPHPHPSARAALALLLWLAGVVGGYGSLMAYAHRAGEAGAAPARPPAELAAPRTPGTVELRVFLHPRCPCSRATLSELERLLADAPGRFRGGVHVFVPAGEGADWARGDLWERARALPGLETRLDPGGVLAERLGARTSGHVVAWDAAGRLAFAGGLTVARGHEGASLARDGLRALALRGAPPPETAPVFGCSLAAPRAREEAP